MNSEKISRRKYLKYVGGAAAAAAIGGAVYYFWPKPVVKRVEIELGPMWWGTVGSVPNLYDLFNEFEKEYPTIDVVDYMPGSNSNLESEKRWAAGDPPELYQNSRWLFQKTLALERVIPVNDVYDEWGLWDKIYKSAIAWNAYDKDIIEKGFKLRQTNVYGFPDAAFPGHYYFDKSRFEEVGIDAPKTSWTLKDLKEAKKVFESAMTKTDFLVAPLNLADWAFITFGSIACQVIGGRGTMETRLGYKSFKDDDWRYAFELAKEFMQEVVSPKSAEMNLTLCCSAVVSRSAVMCGVVSSVHMMPVYSENLAQVPELDLDCIPNIKWVDNPSSIGEVSWGGIFMIPKGLDKDRENAAKTLAGWLWGKPYQEGRGIVGYPGRLMCCSPGANDIITGKLSESYNIPKDKLIHLYGLDWITKTDENPFYTNDCMFPDHAPIINDIMLNFLLRKEFDLEASLEKLDEVSKVGGT